jgi:Uma2 family endonuclease
MIETSILDENDKVELLDGWIVQMPPVGPSHFACIQRIARVLSSLLPKTWHVRPQGPLTLSASEPEPDVTIAKGDIRDWTDRHPGGSDVALVIEVADTSLARDRNAKQQLYAGAGIAEYWIVNLADRQLEIHREPQTTATGPEYRRREIIAASESVRLVIEEQEVGEIKVAELLP